MPPYNRTRSRVGDPPRPRGPALTVDAVWLYHGRVLLVRRGREPFLGRWALPGGFVEPDETVEAAVERELLEETGLQGRVERLLGVYSGPGRDPRGPTVSVAFLMRGRPGAPRGGDDAAFAAWLPIREARPLAFDHALILRDAVRRVRRSARRPRPRVG